jgi:hypothetical protein
VTLLGSLISEPPISEEWDGSISFKSMGGSPVGFILLKSEVFLASWSSLLSSVSLFGSSVVLVETISE